jgi:hypothetical protein
MDHRIREDELLGRVDYHFVNLKQCSFCLKGPVGQIRFARVLNQWIGLKVLQGQWLAIGF